MNIQLIVATSPNGGMGINGGLLFKLPSDLKNFQKRTKDTVLVMGRKTFESLPFVLPGREHVVITGQPFTTAYRGSKHLTDIRYSNSVTYVKGFERALDVASAIGEEKGIDTISIVGGSTVYEESLPYINRAYVTVIFEYPEADVFFPIDKFLHLPFDLTDVEKGFENNLKFEIITYTRRGFV